MTGRRGFTLVEAVVATAVLATAGVALERLIARSVDTIDHDARRARTLVVARAVLAETALRPPAPGRDDGERDGVRWERVVQPTSHPHLIGIEVRAAWRDGGDRAELMEVVYAGG